MQSDEFYNTKTIGFADRESFNNTIILLTMVKSEYYYIVGFSREKGYITIAFDFESDIHSVITEYLTIDFNSDEDKIILKSELKNVSPDYEISEHTENIDQENDKIIFEKQISKDDVFPIGTRQMHKEILSARYDISEFLEKYYWNIIND